MVAILPQNGFLYRHGVKQYGDFRDTAKGKSGAVDIQSQVWLDMIPLGRMLRGMDKSFALDGSRTRRCGRRRCICIVGTSGLAYEKAINEHGLLSRFLSEMRMNQAVSHVVRATPKNHGGDALFQKCQHVV